MSLWSVFITIHAVCAGIAFLTGALLTRRTVANRFTWLLPVFVTVTIIMALAVGSATISHWSALNSGEQVIFGLVLPLLASYMIFRSLQAARFYKHHQWGDFIGGIGFALISYFDAFVIVALLDMKQPVWLTIMVAGLAVVAGSKYISGAKHAAN